MRQNCLRGERKPRKKIFTDSFERNKTKSVKVISKGKYG